MREFLDVGDLVVAEIRSASKMDFNVSLHIRHEQFGKLGKGLLIPVNSCLIQRMSRHIVEQHGLRFIFGVNGFIWIQDVEEQYTLSGLESIAKFRNLVRVLNAAMVTITPDLLFGLYMQLSSVAAKDLLLPANRALVLAALTTQ